MSIYDQFTNRLSNVALFDGIASGTDITTVAAQYGNGFAITLNSVANTGQMVGNGRGGIRGNNASAALMLPALTPTGTDYGASFDLRTFATISDKFPRVYLGNANGDTDAYFLDVQSTAGGTATLVRSVSGVDVTLGTYTFTLSTSSVQHFALYRVVGVSDVTLTPVVDGVVQTPVVDSNVLRITRVGKPAWLMAGASGNTDGMQFPDLSYFAPVVAPSGTQTIAPNNAAIAYFGFTPPTSGFAASVNPGDYLKYVISGNTSGVHYLTFDVSALNTLNYLSIITDGDEAHPYIVPLSSSVPVPTATGSHTYKVVYRGLGNVTAGDTVSIYNTTQTTTTVFTGLKIDSGASISAATLLPNLIHCIGDSVSMGVNATGGDFGPTDGDATKACRYLLGPLCNANVILQAFSGQGVVVAGGSSGTGVPTAPNTYQHYYQGSVSRSLAGFSVVVDAYGQNDANNAGFPAAMVAIIQTIRAASTTAPHLVLGDVRGISTTQEQAAATDPAVSAYTTYFRTDNLVSITGTPNVDSYDGNHPTYIANAMKLLAPIAAQVNALIDPQPITSPPTLSLAPTATGTDSTHIGVVLTVGLPDNATAYTVLRNDVSIATGQTGATYTDSAPYVAGQALKYTAVPTNSLGNGPSVTRFFPGGGSGSGGGNMGFSAVVEDYRPVPSGAYTIPDQDQRSMIGFLVTSDGNIVGTMLGSGGTNRTIAVVAGQTIDGRFASLTADTTAGLCVAIGAARRI